MLAMGNLFYFNECKLENFASIYHWFRRGVAGTIVSGVSEGKDTACEAQIYI